MSAGQTRSRRVLPSILTIVCALAMLLPVVFTSYSLDTDVRQERVDMATPPLAAETLVQYFWCQRPYLSELEVLPARYHGPVEGKLLCRLVMGATDSMEVGRWEWTASQLKANLPLRITFPAIARSGGQEFHLVFQGTPGMPFGLWYSSISDCGLGTLVLNGSVTQGGLRLVTRCQYRPWLAIVQATDGLRRSWWLLFPLAAALLLPGWALSHALGLIAHASATRRCVYSLCINLAFVPLMLLWSTSLGLRWTRLALLMAYLVLVVWCAGRALRFRQALWSIREAARSAVSRDHLPMLLVIATTLWIRFVQIRDLSLPAWVDSTQHALVAQLIQLVGQVPRSFRPLVPVDGFIYHFGFHANLALFQLLSCLHIGDAMLVLGQVLSAASVVSVYLLALQLSGSSLSATIAALLSGLVSYMPAYYVSWGRYTQLTGMILLPTALVATIAWMEQPGRECRRLLLASILHAGLFLTHARVAVFGACFVAAYLVVESLRMRSFGRGRELWTRLVLLGSVSMGLAGPWLLQVISGLRAIATAPEGLVGDPSYNALSEAFLFLPRNRELMVLGVLGALWGICRRRRETFWILVWIALVVVAVNPGIMGLGTTNLLNNASASISLYLPLVVLASQCLATLVGLVRRSLGRRWERIQTQKPSASALLRGLVVGAFLVVGWRYAWGTVDLVNPATVLADERDLTAMVWIRHNTPASAIFLINARPWQLGLYVGTDGGYWIPQLAERKTLLPPLPYAYGSATDRRRVATLAQIVVGTTGAGDPRLRELMRREGVTHVYIGSLGGPLKPEWFAQDSGYRLVYSDGCTWVFEVVGLQ